MVYRKRIYYTDADRELMWDRWQVAALDAMLSQLVAEVVANELGATVRMM